MLAVVTAVSAILLSGFSHVASGPDGGLVLSGTFPGTVRPGLLYLPPGFRRSERYPVLYLLHGMPGSPSEYLYGTQLAERADQEISAQRLRPFIAVIPAAGAKRGYNGEWAGPWEDGLVERTVPWVDTNLPTIPSAAGRVIAGLSAGASARSTSPFGIPTCSVQPSRGAATSNRCTMVRSRVQRTRCWRRTIRRSSSNRSKRC